MALELNTDIAQEMNITARRNDSFQMQLGVSDPTNSSITYDLAGQQSGFSINTTNFGIDYYGLGPMGVYQAKMTIKKQSSEYETLNVYTWFWKEKRIQNVIPSLIKTGNFSGEASGNLGALASQYAGIWLSSSTGAVGDTIFVSIPSEYMDLEPGEYVYDFQLRKKPIFNGAHSEVGTVYTTLLRGTFTIIDDITKQ